MMIFKTTRNMALLDRKNNTYNTFGDKKVLSDFLGISKDTITGWFRPENGIKPKIKRYNDYEIIDLDGHYKDKKIKL